MAKTPKQALEFLEMLDSELDEIFGSEMKILQATKESLTPRVGRVRTLY